MHCAQLLVYFSRTSARQRQPDVTEKRCDPPLATLHRVYRLSGIYPVTRVLCVWFTTEINAWCGARIGAGERKIR